MRTRIACTAWVLLFAVEAAQARIFNLTKESFASYLSFQTGGSNIKDGLFADESSATGFSKGLTSSMGGEFGFVSRMDRAFLRFGFEILKPNSLKDVRAESAGGAALYSASSEITGFVPKIGIDLSLLDRPLWRIFVFGSAGLAHVTVENSYSGLAIAPNADFETQWKGNGNSLAGGLGVEYAALDLTSIVLEVGYRDLKIRNLKYGEAVTDFQGTHDAGDPVRLSNGKKRDLDFSGWTVNLGARWWLF